MIDTVFPRLTAIDASAMSKAISEFNELGRTAFLKRYGFQRSSKFYFIYRQRLYDTKALVAAAYCHATGKKKRRNTFSGGAQTEAVFVRLKQNNPRFAGAVVFEDTLGELRNLSSEFDRIPRAWTNMRALGFSKWIPITQSDRLNTGYLPGVYVIAQANSPSDKMVITDKRILYVGETVSQNLRKRLHQFKRSLQGNGGHSGGETLMAKGYATKKLWLSIRAFPWAYGIEDSFAESFRSSQIRHLERMLLYEYVLANRRYPRGNSR